LKKEQIELEYHYKINLEVLSLAVQLSLLFPADVCSIALSAILLSNMGAEPDLKTEIA
jgi:hypothetical protein